jgi:putative membrane protein
MHNPLALAAVAIALFAAAPAFGMSDGAFLSETIRSDNSVILLSRLAGERGASVQARNIARIIEVDHRRERRGAAKLARRRGFAPPAGPTSQGESQSNQLRTLRGVAFDKQFVRDMTADDEKALAAAEREAGTAVGRVAKYAARRVPVLKRSLRLSAYLAKGDAAVGDRSRALATR